MHKHPYSLVRYSFHYFPFLQFLSSCERTQHGSRSSSLRRPERVAEQVKLPRSGLLWGLEKDKQKLESNLLVIRAVLYDAEKQQVSKMAVKDWLRKLEDAAYDAEDLVDEFIFEARRRKVVNQQGMQKKVRNFCSLSNPLVFCTKMAHKMQKMRERFDAIAEERNAFHFKEEAVESRPPISRTRETDSYVIKSEVRGRKNEAEKLIHSLINFENEEVLSVIPIVGMGGMGKATLAQLVFNDEKVGTHFRDCPRLMSVSNQLENLHALETLFIDGCTDLLLSLPNGGLQHHQQQSPPLNPLEMLRNLTFLQIDGCPKVFSFLSLKNLKSLEQLKNFKVSRCDEFTTQHAESLTSLAWLMIWNCPGMSSLPESMGDLTSLTMLWISDCPGLSSLPESMGDLTSLKILGISKCPEITTLPEGLQRLTDLQHLLISGCPILKTRLRCNEGQDWHKVAHVPYIKIDYQDLRDSLSSVGHPSLMDSLKMGCNIFNTKKLLLPPCCSSSPSSSSTSPPT